ncbi:MAG: helix-turn-helix domain-containing protein [Candidatus Omnitrophota bacterium]
MKTFRKHLNTKLKDEKFKKIYDEEHEMIQLSLELLNIRKEAGLSQQDLASKAHITQQQLSKIESGKNCNILTLLKVCHVLHVKLKLLYNEANNSGN